MTQPDPWTCPICGTKQPVPSLAQSCCSKGEPVPEPTKCPVVVNGIACNSGQRIILGLCHYHYRQVRGNRPVTPFKARRAPGSSVVRDENGNKQCGRCNEWIPEDQFTTNTASSDRRQPWCKQCVADHMSIGRYGFPRSVVAERVAEQGGCAICKCTDPSSNGYRSGWHVDHDHACCPGTKTCGNCIRSILCARCNKVLGAVNDDPDLLIAAAEYLLAAVDRHEKETAP